MKKRGISLILLVITIIVIVILAGAIILSLSNNNPIEVAEEANFKNNISQYNSELSLWLSNEYLNKLGEIDVSTINATKDIGTYEDLLITDIITIMSDNDAQIFEIQAGKLVYVGTNEKEKIMASEAGIGIANTFPIPYTDEEIANLIQNEGYIPVATADELNNIRYATSNTFGAGTLWEAEYIGGIDKKYLQISNIDLSSYSEGEGWIPIVSNEDEDEGFAGIYDGNNYKISNLYINMLEEDYAGLFGSVTSNNVEFKNLNIDNININNTSYSGGLVGIIVGSSCKVTNIHTSGSITDVTAQTGGLVGMLSCNDTIISDCSSSVNIFNEDQDVILGGLIGANYTNNNGDNSILNCYATGDVEGNNSIGGLIGYTSSGTVTNCYATGDVKGENDVGGLLGAVYTNITNCYATGDVEGNNSIGGLIGYANSGTTIANVYATGDVDGNNSVGGLLGESYSNITDAYATGYVIGSDDVGGLIGYTSSGTITNCYAIGNVDGNNTVGGLFGESYNNITDAYATGNVTGINKIGGLGGYMGGDLTNVYALGNVIGSDNVGGLLGQGNASITLSYTNNEVSGENNVGGLLGKAAGNTISSSYSTSLITGVNNVGGLVGLGAGTRITNSYVNNTITATGDYIGGLIGNFNWDSILNSYAVNSISGNNYIGGLIGGPDDYGYPTVSGYWNTDISNIFISASEGVGKTTSEMKTQSTFIDWDFANIWAISASKNNGYPYLKELESTL